MLTYELRSLLEIPLTNIEFPKFKNIAFLDKNTSLAAPGALAHRLQRRTACNTSPPAKSNMADGVWK